MESKQVYKAISEVAAHIAKEGIAKGRKNAQQGYSFRGVDDIYNALATALVNAGLIIIPRVISRDFREVETKSGGRMNYVTVEAEYDFVCVKDGSLHTARVVGEAMDSADKATNKAMSAAYKYLCLQTFCIPTEGDNDADATTPEPTVVRRQQPVNNVPTKGEKEMLIKLMESSTLTTDQKAKTFVRISNCQDYTEYQKIQHGLEAVQPSIDQTVNPSQKQINQHLKTVQS